MVLSAFLEQLVNEGRVHVGRESAAPEKSDGDAGAPLHGALRDLDRRVRSDMPLDAPALDLAVAMWAACVLHDACACVAHRDLDIADVRARLERPCPAPPSPSVCYSADLTLRALPDLAVLARGIAPGDPLLDLLRGLARRWPLSSVGFPGASDVDVAPFIDDASLRRTYADRIIARGDDSRLADPRVRAAVAECLGDHTDLAAGTAAALAALAAEDRDG